MTPEQLSVLLFVLAVPLIAQLVKFIGTKIGHPVPTWVIQVIAGALSAGFVALSGGFAGLVIPVFTGDPLAFAGALYLLLAAAWGSVELTYRIVLKRLFEAIGLV